MNLIVWLLGLSAAAATSAEWQLPTPIEVVNGAPWGTWGALAACPQGSKAVGFSVKIEREALDLTAVNGLGLHCSDEFGNETVIESDSERFGQWGPLIACSSGHLTAFSLRVQPPGQREDETAVNDIQFACSSGQILQGGGLDRGEFGPWSGHCPAGICAFESRIQEYEGLFTDDTALNNLVFYCC